jgi:hypothetical protein
LKDELDEFRRLIGPFDPSSSLRGALEAKIETWANLYKRWPYLTPDERDRVLSRCRHAYFHLQEYKANRKISTDTLLHHVVRSVLCMLASVTDLNLYSQLLRHCSTRHARGSAPTFATAVTEVALLPQLPLLEEHDEIDKCDMCKKDYGRLQARSHSPSLSSTSRDRFFLRRTHSPAAPLPSFLAPAT